MSGHNAHSKPSWLRIRLPRTDEYRWMNQMARDHQLHTICTSGKCPNAAECWGRGTATFMILGDICTRSCRFCNVLTGRPLPPDPEEPLRLARTIRQMNLKHIVITSVDRDDLPDGGAGAWAQTISAIKQWNPSLTIEALIPDFDGQTGLIDQVLEASPEVVSHNVETVRRLTPLIRSRAKYEVSLRVLARIAASHSVAKSGLMLGLGETEEEVCQAMDDLRTAGVEVLTLGQYLQPHSALLPVSAYISPEQFDKYRDLGIERGFRVVESGPLVRSSYHAENHVFIK